METAEQIVEAYVRYIRRWATIANVKCPAQHEVDLLAVDLASLERYHIEVSVLISHFGKLTGKTFSQDKWKDRLQKPSQRMTVGYFIERKFDHPEVVKHLQEYYHFFEYRKVLVCWAWTEEAAQQAAEANIQLWSFPSLIQELAATLRKSRAYFGNPTLRSLQLFLKALGK